MHTNKLSGILLVALITFASTPVWADDDLNNDFNNLSKNINAIFQKTSTMVQDATISAAITTKFMLDKNLAPYNIDTTSDNGVVTLTGEVNSASDVKTAIAMAMATNGVKSVNASKLTVKKK